jgi:hypothetical protein
VKIVTPEEFLRIDLEKVGTEEAIEGEEEDANWGFI